MYYVFENLSGQIKVIGSAEDEKSAYNILLDDNNKSQPRKMKLNIYYYKSSDFNEPEQNAIDEYLTKKNI